MVGVQLNAIKPGSLFEQIGIKNGDVITELNGIKIDSPEQSAKILLEFVDAKSFDVVVENAQGTQSFDVYAAVSRARARGAQSQGGDGGASPIRIDRGRGDLRVILASAALAQPPAGGMEAPPAGVKPVDGDLYSLDFNDVELAVVIDTIAQLTDKNFIYDDRVRGRVTIVSPDAGHRRAGLRRVRVGAPGEGLHHGDERPAAPSR